MLIASAAITIGGWLVFVCWIPALVWAERPTPFGQILDHAPRVGLVTLPMALLGVLLIGYLGLCWVAWRSKADLPAPIVLGTFAISGLCAALTYSLFANDVYYLLSNVWTLATPRMNPYEVTPATALAGSAVSPYVEHSGTLGGTEYLYGPAWLIVGLLMMKLLGPSVALNFLATKVLMLAVLAAMGMWAARWATMQGLGRPMAAAALVLWNPLLLVEGVMTPHLDLPMAAALLGCLVAWRAGERWEAIAGFALSIAVKLVTLILAPALVGALLAAGLVGRRQWRAVLGTAVVLGAITAALWPGVWQPFWQHGLRASLEFSSNAALLSNLIAALDNWGLLPPDPSRDAVAVARASRWVAFVPVWAIGTFACVCLGRAWPRALPTVLVEPLALILLSYHVLFTVWVQSWHFITPLAVCLFALNRRGQVAALFITVSGLVHTVSAQWLGQPALMLVDQRIHGYILTLSLMSGPLVAMGLLAWTTWTRTRAARTATAATVLARVGG